MSESASSSSSLLRQQRCCSVGSIDSVCSKSSSKKRPRHCSNSIIDSEAHISHHHVDLYYQRVSITRTRRKRYISCASLILSLMTCPAQSTNSIQHSSLRSQQQRILQGFGLNIGAGVNLDKCYAHLHAADINENSILSPPEFLTYVQSSAEGLLDTNIWGLPITEFNFLPQEFIGIYNFFACGNANYGCPSVEGIDISGVAEEVEGEEESESDIGGDQQTILMFQLCKLTQQAIDDLKPKTDSPTSSPFADVVIFNITTAPTSSPTLESTDNDPTPTPTPAGTILFCPPTYQEGIQYNAGEMVSQNINNETTANMYKCKPFPQSGWCSQPVFEPEVGLNWGEAWDYVGECTITPDGTTNGTIDTQEPTASKSPVSAPSSIILTSTPTSDNVTLQTPTYSPTPFEPTTSTKPPTLPICPPLYVLDAEYNAGDTVSQIINETTGETHYYQCKLSFFSGWCSQSVYAPGVSDIWDNAWTFVGDCVVPGSTIITTSKPTVVDYTTSSSPTFKPSVVSSSPPTTTMITKPPVKIDENDPPYSGPLVTTFQYEIYNTQDLSASSIETGTNPENDMMSVLTTSTNDFVQDVVDTTFGTTSITYGGIDQSKGNRIYKDGNIRRRRLKVILEPQSVSIKKVEDVPCFDSSSSVTTNDRTGAICQMVTAQSQLILIDEPRQATQLKFSSSISRALYEPGITFPDSSGIVYLGPDESSLEVIQGKKPDDNSPNDRAPPEDEESGTPDWVVPVSIGAAAVGAIVLVLLVGARVQKRKRDGIQYQGYVGREANAGEMSGDLIDLECRPNSSDDDVAVFVGRQDKISPLDATGSSPFPDNSRVTGETLSTDKAVYKAKNNPFSSSSSSSSSEKSRRSTDKAVFNANIHSSSSSSSSGSSASGSSYSSGVPSGSYSSGTSSSSEDESHDEQALKQQQQQLPQQLQNTPSQPPQAQQQQKEVGLWALSTLPENSDENLSSSKSQLSVSESTGAESQKSVYRAGVEALVKQVCPEKMNQIDDMMAEYDGREDVLIGELSAQLAAMRDSDTEAESSLAERKNSIMSTLTGEQNNDDNHSDALSSSAGSSDWSSDDGFSSIGTGSLNTDQSEADNIAALADIAALDQIIPSPLKTEGYLGSSNPLFAPVDDISPSSTNEVEDDQTETDQTSQSSESGMNTATREDLDAAIQAGDWKAVGATAALIASSSPSKRSTDDFRSSDADLSNYSISAQERSQVNELEQLVESGDWQEVIRAATRFENASESDYEDSIRDETLMDSLVGVNNPSLQSSPDSTNTKSSAEWRAEVEELVITVVPSELENIDEMMIQFRGREAELVSTLKTMKRKTLSSGETTKHPDDGGDEDDLSDLGGSSTRGSNSVSIFESDREDITISTAERKSSYDDDSSSEGSSSSYSSSEGSNSEGSSSEDLSRILQK